MSYCTYVYKMLTKYNERWCICLDCECAQSCILKHALATCWWATWPFWCRRMQWLLWQPLLLPLEPQCIVRSPALDLCRQGEGQVLGHLHEGKDGVMHRIMTWLVACVCTANVIHGNGRLHMGLLEWKRECRARAKNEVERKHHQIYKEWHWKHSGIRNEPIYLIYPRILVERYYCCLFSVVIH